MPRRNFLTPTRIRRLSRRGKIARASNPNAYRRASHHESKRDLTWLFRASIIGGLLPFPFQLLLEDPRGRTLVSRWQSIVDAATDESRDFDMT